MSCHHTTVVLKGPGIGGCLECKQEVILREVLVLDKQFHPPVEVPQKKWALRSDPR